MNKPLLIELCASTLHALEDPYAVIQKILDILKEQRAELKKMNSLPTE